MLCDLEKTSSDKRPALIVPWLASSGCGAGWECLNLQPLTANQVILSTNLAESSITIPDVSIVINSGLEKGTHPLAPAHGLCLHSEICERHAVRRVWRVQSTRALGRKILGYMAKEIQTLIAQGRSTKIISMIRWIRTSRLSTKKSLSDHD